MKTIEFPSRYTPGLTDNFVSNEVIVANVTVADVWRFLVNPFAWETYYNNAGNIKLYDAKADDQLLHWGQYFDFDTFGFPIKAQVMELVEPTTTDNQFARIAWHGWNEASGDEHLDVYHAFLIEQLPQQRVRILTQESQIGAPAAALRKETPNPMLNGHQAWLDGLAQAASTYAANN